MEFRIHEVLSWIVPGIFLIFLCLIFWLCSSYSPCIDTVFANNNECNDECYKTIPWDFLTALAIFVIPVLGLIVGYAINFIASLLEHLIYTIPWISRPSKRILNNKTWRSKVAEISKLYDFLEITNITNGCPNPRIDNKKARHYRDIAVQAIDHEVMERYYFRMIFGRNMTMSQILAFGASFVFLGINYKVCLAMLIVLIIFICAYYRDSMTHTKYSFIEFMRIKQNQATNV